MEEYCENCGAQLKANSKFCHECGSEIKTEKANYCENCGSELTPGDDFCGECGHSMNRTEPPAVRTKDNNRKIIIGLGVIAAAVLVGAILFSGVLTPEVPLVTQDFGVFTMLVPEGSNYVETSSLPSYGFGGYIGMENAGAYSKEVFSIMISTIQGGTHPSEVSLDRQVGDITVYKDNQGHDTYYLERTVGEYEVTLIGNDDDAMIKMLQSIELAD